MRLFIILKMNEQISTDVYSSAPRIRAHRSSIQRNSNQEGADDLMFNNSGEEDDRNKEESSEKIQVPFSIVFRCKMMLGTQLTDTLILERVDPIKVIQSDDHFTLTIKKKNLIRNINAFQADPKPQIANLQYFDSELQGWKLIQDEVNFQSSQLYREDNKIQKPLSTLVIDLKASISDPNPTSQNPFLAHRLVELESLVLSIGVQIVQHFTENTSTSRRLSDISEEQRSDCGGVKQKDDCNESTEEEDSHSQGSQNQGKQEINQELAKVKSQNSKRSDKNKKLQSSIQMKDIMKKQKFLQNHLFSGNLALQKRIHSNFLQQMTMLSDTDDLQMPNIQTKSKSTLLNNLSKFPTLLGTSKTSSQNSTLDLAYLYADPLLIEVVKDGKRQLDDFNKPLEIEQEFDQIVDCLRKTKKKFTVTKMVATCDNLKSIMAARPQMIHISCHGDCLIKKVGKVERKSYYLAFEEVDRFCVLDKLTEDRLNKLLGNYEEHGVKVVFVSACHSEMIGQIFKRVGVPVVIAVNSLTPILDDVCKKFSRHFYEHLVQGSTPNEAFKAGKNAVEGSKKINVSSCCCAHQHKPWCKWEKHFDKRKAEQYDKNESHNAHMPNAVEPNCRCPKDSNIHKFDCHFYMTFRETFIPNDTEMRSLKLDIDLWETQNSRTRTATAKVCCCSPEFPHNETQKFMIIQRNFEKENAEAQKALDKSGQGDEDVIDSTMQVISEEKIKKLKEIDNEVLNYKLFNDRDDGVLDIQGNMDCINQVKHWIDPDMLIGRNLIIKDIVQKISESHRLLHVFGCDGNGKSSIVNYAAKYALYGRVELDGAVYVDADNKETVDALIQSICRRLSERILIPSNQGEYFIEDIIRVINQHKYLIILDNLKSLISKNKDSLNRFISELLDKTQKTKLIVITHQIDDITSYRGSSSQSNMDKKEIIQVKELSDVHAAQLVLKIASQSQHLKGYQNEIKLKKHEIFNKITLKPTVITQIAKLLLKQSLESVVEQLDEESRQQEMKKREVENQQKTGDNQPIQNDKGVEDNQLNQTNEISFIMKITIEKFFKENPINTYLNEYQILYNTCNMPNGLFSSDIDQISQIGGRTNVDWRQFFSLVTQEDENLKTKEQENQQKDQAQVSPVQKLFHLLNHSYNQDLKQDLYLPIPIIKDIFLGQLDQMPQFKDQNNANQTLRQLAIIARNILQIKFDQIKNQIDHKVVTAAIDQGIWKGSDSSTAYQIEQSFNPDAMFQAYESNLSHFLDLQTLTKANTQNNLNQLGETEELAQCIVSYLIQSGQYGKAQLQITNMTSVAEHFKLQSLQAKLILLECSLQLKSKEDLEFQQMNQMLEKLKFAKETFGKQHTNGQAEALFIGTLVKTKINQQQLDEYRYQVRQKVKKVGLSINRQTINQVAEQEDNNEAKQKIADQIEDILVQLESARKLFKSNGIQFGVAKCSMLEAQFILDLLIDDDCVTYGLKLPRLGTEIIDQLSEAISFYEQFSYQGLSARAYKLRGLVFWKMQYDIDRENQNLQELKSTLSIQSSCNQVIKDPIQNLHQAKLDMDRSLSQYMNNRDQDQILVVNMLLESILDLIKKNSQNVLIFSKAAPLAQINQSTELAEIKSVGPLTVQNSDFNQWILKEAKQSGQEVNIQCDLLNRELLNQIKNNNCKLLHLYSDVFEEDRLCIEGKNGVAEYLTLDELKKSFMPTQKQDKGLNQMHHKENLVLGVQLIVLAMPFSNKLAENFVEMGVKHVISFGFESFVKYDRLLPKIRSMIQQFCKNFYKKLFENLLTIDQAFKETTNEIFESDFRDIIEQFNYLEDHFGQNSDNQEQTFDQLMKQGPKLSPFKRMVHSKLFFQPVPEELKNEQEPFIDSSKKGRPTNIYKVKQGLTQFTGRKSQIYELIQNLNSQQRLINICGPKGLGKTAFVLQTAKYLSDRASFENGIVYTNLKHVQTAQQFRERLRKSMVQADLLEDRMGVEHLNSVLKKDQILYIMDNVDLLIADKREFNWSIVNLLTMYENMRVILISRNEIKSDHLKGENSLLMIKHMPPLTDEESVDLILSTCERELLDDLKNKKNSSVTEYLMNDSNFQMCHGFPDLLIILAKALSMQKPQEIDIKTLIKRENLKRFKTNEIYKNRIERMIKIFKGEGNTEELRQQWLQEEYDSSKKGSSFADCTSSSHSSCGDYHANPSKNNLEEEYKEFGDIVNQQRRASIKQQQIQSNPIGFNSYSLGFAKSEVVVPVKRRTKGNEKEGGKKQLQKMFMMDDEDIE